MKQIDERRTNETPRTLDGSMPELKEYLKHGSAVLDVGCGPGTITADVAEAVEGACGYCCGHDVYHQAGPDCGVHRKSEDKHQGGDNHRDPARPHDAGDDTGHRPDGEYGDYINGGEHSFRTLWGACL